MEPESSSPYSQVRAARPYPELTPSSHHNVVYIIYINDARSSKYQIIKYICWLNI